MKKIDDSYVNNIKETLLKTIKEVENPIAAFDADGTLWPTDMGEIFFRYQIKNNLIDLPPKPWEHYINLHSEKPKDAYLWLAQINKGRNISKVREWAQAAVDEKKNFEIFDEQKQIIDLFHENNIPVYIVTASVKWAVEPAAKKFNIPFENVVGIVTKVENDMVTDIQGGPITYREGKVNALLEHTNNIKPFFASGNTMGDISLVECATHHSLTIRSADKQNSNWGSEESLNKISTEKNWFQFNYLP